MSSSVSAGHAATPARTHGADRAVRLWLAGVAALVLAMVVVGGATRLTGSGLSITEWKPIIGALPPLSAEAWQEAFVKYRETLQYKHLNAGMSLEAFKFIFWWEWAHRFLGRAVGLAFALPFAWFWWRGALRPGLAPKLLGLLFLGGLQGVIGWYMVQSGLVDRIDVSQYRLALHLSLAIALFGLLLWLALELRDATPAPRSADATAVHRGLAIAFLVLIFLQIVFGALVAGLKAGLTYNTWPLMDGRLIPHGLFSLVPWHLNLFENITMVQFQHRMLGYLLCAVAIAQLAFVRPAYLMVSAVTPAVAVVLQAGIGIWTLLSAAGSIPIALGLLHQLGAVVVFGLAVWHLHRVFRAGPA